MKYVNEMYGQNADFCGVKGSGIYIVTAAL
jgi:hypothetical protein